MKDLKRKRKGNKESRLVVSIYLVARPLFIRVENGEYFEEKKIRGEYILMLRIYHLLFRHAQTHNSSISQHKRPINSANLFSTLNLVYTPIQITNNFKAPIIYTTKGRRLLHGKTYRPLISYGMLQPPMSLFLLLRVSIARMHTHTHPF